MPLERAPRQPLPQDYYPKNGTPYHVQDNDDWYSVARKFDVDVGRLIDFNFHTRIPEEVNWYLRRNVGCVKSTPDQKKLDVQLRRRSRRHLYSSGDVNE